MSNSRSRKIRRLMAETGMNYLKAAQELDRQETAADADIAMSGESEFSDAILAHLNAVQQGADRFAAVESALTKLNVMRDVADRAARFAVPGVMQAHLNAVQQAPTRLTR